ncbi:hypothetical protein EUX98_g1587 [Antrodiella citrinella]|uniref:Chitobiosyldiphosphodolichol beta-mannosyltransferase n=1 Tax=Antrodiella citrinella TaxID=2447956 RepID=A0A4S4N456_9APHY|nr:hypothetical protein EUX98_g1587 [Antrodiella citrinella]
MKLGERHILVRIAKRFESYFGRTAYAHLFVTNAMHDHLVKEWDLQGLKVVLHDRPPAHFHRSSPSEIHELFLRLEPSLSTRSLQTFLPKSDAPHATPFTEITFSIDPNPTPRPDRPALLVSSTSWTPDEDFSILLEALQLYETKAAEANGMLPKVLMVVTGKGPEREKYMREIEKLQNGSREDEGWKWVSSSALDLPMKVVDMFGCGLPVCALNFACLDELVKDGVNGLVFNNAEQLSVQLESLLTSFPESKPLSALRANFITDTMTQEAVQWQWGTWQKNWNTVMRPLILRDVPERH